MVLEFKQVKERAQDILQANGVRVNICQAMDDLYWMRWGEESVVKDQLQNVKITRSPRARNAIQGAMRLMVASDPIISVPSDINNPSLAMKSSNIEKFLKAMWFASGRVAGDPIHYDVIRSALLYGDVILSVDSTGDMAKMAGNRPGLKKRLEDISARTPYLFSVMNPKNCHLERDKFGPTAFYRKMDVKAGHIMDTFGDKGMTALSSHHDKKSISRTDKVVLSDYYDLDQRTVWLDGYDKPILEEEHGLPFLPVVGQIAEGSSLFDTEEEKHEPFLYTLWRSGIADRQNLLLTVLYTMVFSIGANPMFVDYLVNPDDPHEVDYSVPGGTMHYRVGERREPMAKQVIDPSIMQSWEIANDLEMQSTIYRQTLGEPLGANAPYSMVALLSQSGRLPLVSIQRKAGWAIAEAMEIALQWLKVDGKKATASYEALSAELTPADIPDHVDVKVQLEIELPQDRLNAANAANMLTQGENPMVSLRWVRENVLNVGQSGDMTKEIWNERSANMMYQQYVQQQMAAAAQQAQMAMAQGAGAGMPGGPPPMQGGMPSSNAMMPGVPGQVPEQMGTPPQPGVQPMNPPIEPIPPMPGFMPPNVPRGE